MPSLHLARTRTWIPQQKHIRNGPESCARRRWGAHLMGTLDEDSEAYNLVLAELERLELAQANMRQRAVHIMRVAEDAQSEIPNVLREAREKITFLELEHGFQ